MNRKRHQTENTMLRQHIETSEALGRTGILKTWNVRRSAWLALPLGALTACGPLPPSDGHGDDEYGGYPDGYGAALSTGGTSSVGGAESVGGQAAGGSGTCDIVAPQRTYVCSGWAFESETLGAAGLHVITEMCGDSYGGTGGWYGGTGGAIATGGTGWGGFAGEMALSTGGVTDGEPADGVGGTAYDDDDGYYYGVGGEPFYGVGGNYYGGTGGIGPGGSGNSSYPRWCDSDPVGTVSGGISFAVGACQDVDVALPLLFQEPYGDFEVSVYGAYSPCDRGVPIATAAGIGTGQLLEIPFSTAGFSFISVEVRGDVYSDFGIRLRDRPRVVPVPSE